MNLRSMKLSMIALACLASVGCQSADKGSETKSQISPTNPLVAIALVKVKPGSEATFEAAARAILRPTRAESGNISYDFNHSISDATEFATYEQWSSESALQAHMKSSHMQKFFGIVGNLFEEGYPQIKSFEKIQPASGTRKLTENPLIVIAMVKVIPGNQSKFQNAAKDILQPTRAEPGNMHYDFNASKTDKTEFATYEQWTDAGALDKHMKHVAHMQKFFGIVGPLFAEGYPQIVSYKRLEP